MEGKFAGPITVKRFLKDYLPIPEAMLQSMPNFNNHMKSFAEVSEQKTEAGMYGPMVR
jgi:glycine cleavage system protein P-like pyridoxal-binding family